MYFILIHSKDTQVVEKAKALYSTQAGYKVEQKHGEAELLLYSNKQVDRLNLVSVINYTGDIENNATAYLGNNHDAIAAKMIVDEKQVTFITDYWGILPFYYHQSAGTFVISNNIFLVRELTDPRISRDAVWEALLFKRPLKARTWYDSINATLPNEVVSLNLASGQVSISGGHFELSLFEQDRTDYVEAMSDFFNRAFHYIGDHKLKPAISISAGSDSRTVLAGVMNHTADFNAYSWGGDNYLETARISQLVQRFNLNWKLQNFDRFREQERQITLKSQLISNGLARRKHFFYHYSFIPNGSALFEGYGGSELVKTELSEGMLTEPYRFLISHRTKPEYYLRDYFSDMESVSRSKLLKYLCDEYMEFLADVNSTKGFEMHQLMVLKSIPARIFNGIFNTALYGGITLFEPFFSRQVLSALYSNGLGLKHSTSVSAAHPGKYGSVKPEAGIVKKLYPALLLPQLDRGFSMKELDSPERLTWLLNKGRNLVHKIRVSKDVFTGQVDMKRIETIDLGKNLHPFLAEIMSKNYDRNNACIENTNACLNGLDYVHSSESVKLMSEKQKIQVGNGFTA